MATIKPIDGRSVHQIQSGQVIVDLQSVCKELVENSIDAGATSVEVRFKNNGLDAIEVQDNGSGIAPDDFETIALKHYTSKLSTYDDLNALQTFGFRGEALSSLCALSKFHIITARASDGPKGTKLEFEQSGKLKGTSVVAAKQGTTVVVDTLFYNLPVRRKELEKNIKREYNKVLSLLNAYACISTGVKFSVSNLMAKGKKTVAFSTNANPNTKENIANVYGTKTLLALLPLNLEFEMDPTNQTAHRKNTDEDADSRKVKIVGHISRPVVGEGRQTPDRQMFFVNSRPCILPQVAKAFNEVYKSYNITQSPFIFADLKLDTNAYDVNVSPDKRTILLHDQTALLESLKDALVELFEGHDQSVPQSQLLGKSASSRLPFKNPSTQRQESVALTIEEREEDDGTMEIVNERRPPTERPSSPQLPKVSDRTGFVKASMLSIAPSDDIEEDKASYPPTKRRKSNFHEQDRSSGETGIPSVRSDHSSPEQNNESANHERGSLSPLFEPENLQSIRSLPPDVRILRDFNARVASHHARQLEREATPTSPDLAAAGDEEESIPAIKQTPQTRSSQSTIQNAFDRMRPMRTPVQKATITVGNTTTVSTIGGSRSNASGLSRRDRIHSPRFSLDGTPLKPPEQLSILKSLRGFTAPGSQIPGSDGREQEEEEEEEEEEVEQEEGSDDNEYEQEDNAMTDVTNRTSNARTRSVMRSSSESQNDDIEESSSVLPSVGEVSGDIDAPERRVEQSDDPGSGDEYVDESEKKAREDAKVAQMIAEAEESAARPTEMNLKRASKLFKVSQKKYSTVNTEQTMKVDLSTITQQLEILETLLEATAAETTGGGGGQARSDLDEDPEERLSLTVTKSDFNKMRIIGQFNLGFILAVRSPTSTSPTFDLFIIDQHASDEKYNFERFSATTVLVSQRLVHPHPLELTAVEEEIILANGKAFSANGFVVEMDMSGHKSVGHRAQLTSLPMSKEVTFTPTDLEELIALILDNPPSSSLSTSAHIPRPSKVRKLLASRACRSSVMIGKTLKVGQMESIVRHMGSMDKPWSCPHGRPTMRHLFGLEKWEGWKEGDGVVGVDESEVESSDWTGYLKRRRKGAK